MTTDDIKPQAYYARSGIMTDPGDYAPMLDALPADIAELCEVVQGLLVHVFWAERYGLALSEARKQEVGLRAISDKLARIQELDDRALTTARPLERRLVGNCRDFSVVLCALLRHQGMPARARCGFGTYFLPGHYEDHWVCEYWNAAQRRWILIDAQLDTFQRQELQIQFDPLDVPRDQFLTGGQAWQMCRSGQADPDDFGIFDMHGLWFVRGDLVRDFLALNKIEILPWDPWGEAITGASELPAEQTAFFDRLAELTLAGDEAFPEIRALYKYDRRIAMPTGWPHE
jgi:hypothetical protein